jgi:hypothetical protein
MTKITVEIPAGMTAAEFTSRVEMIGSPDWVASWWHIDDVIECCDWQGFELTDDDAREALRLADKYHDAEHGINWAVLQSWVDHIVKQKEKAA